MFCDVQAGFAMQQLVWAQLWDELAWKLRFATLVSNAYRASGLDAIICSLNRFFARFSVSFESESAGELQRFCKQWLKTGDRLKNFNWPFRSAFSCSIASVSLWLSSVNFFDFSFAAFADFAMLFKTSYSGFNSSSRTARSAGWSRGFWTCSLVSSHTLPTSFTL